MLQQIMFSEYLIGNGFNNTSLQLNFQIVSHRKRIFFSKMVQKKYTGRDGENNWYLLVGENYISMDK